MKIFLEPVSFEWDTGNLDKNWEKHGVTNQEAEETFFHTPRFVFEDEPHSPAERRYLLLGITEKGKKLSIVFTIRGNRVRIISARNMSKKERQVYEKKAQEHP